MIFLPFLFPAKCLPKGNRKTVGKSKARSTPVGMCDLVEPKLPELLGRQGRVVEEALPEAAPDLSEPGSTGPVFESR
jgi:hypothetical protein